MKKLLTFLILIVLGITESHAQFSGGNGTSGEPFKIKTSQDVDNLRNYLGNLGVNKHFRIVKDIDMESYITGKYGNNGWNPIGNESSPFQGFLHGGSYRIEGLYANRATMDFVGLFGVLGSQGKVDSLGIITSDTKSFKGRKYVGLFAGSSKGAISSCYAKGSVEGTEEVGGIVGINDDTIKYSYNQAKVTGTVFCGGIAGVNRNKINYCYSAAQIVCNSVVGALVGLNLKDVHSCYWDATLMNNGCGSNQRGTFIASGKSTADMKKASTYAYEGWRFSTYWKIKDNYTYPLLKWEITTPSAYQGDGTEENPFEIYTASDLDNLRTHLGGVYVGKHFKIMRDINLSSYCTGTNGWLPIGTATEKFNAFLHGGGHKLYGLAMNRNDYYVGLFGYVGTEGVIDELILETGVNKEMGIGSYGVGALAGHNEGIIEFCANWGDVRGGSAAGGLVGHNEGTVRYCYNKGKITSGSRIGGIIGNNKGTVIQTYNVGEIILSGGSNSLAGAIIGVNQSLGVTSCYFDKEISVAERGFGDNLPTRSLVPTGLTTEQAKRASSYVGWDFANEWRIVDDYTYPLLRFEEITGEWTGETFAGGIGTADRPYQIATPEHLDNVRRFPDANFKIVDNIDLTDFISDEYGTEEWLPIGDESNPFSGTIDGQHFVISGLSINRPDSDNIGLFGVISNSQIKRMTVVGHENNPIVGRNNIGMLIGKGSSSEVEKCCVIAG